MRKLKLIILILLVLTHKYSFANKGISPKFFAYNSIYDIKNVQKLSETVVIFSSRDYITNILKNNNHPAKIYWVLPVDELKKEDADIFFEHIKKQFNVVDVKFSPEGINVLFEKTHLFIMLFENIPMVNMEDGDVFIDVDYFFRSYKIEIKTPKVESVINIFNAFKEFEWGIKNIYLIKSLDINLPDWVQEYAFLVKKVYEFWVKKIFPKPLLALDFVDQALFYFAQYDEAYDTLKEVEEFHKDNPYFYKRLFWASLKNYKDEDVLRSAKNAYELDRQMIALYLEGADLLISKAEIYPAFVLLTEGLKLEPWNSKLKEKLNSTIEIGYDYYNTAEGDKELFEFFKREKEKLKR